MKRIFALLIALWSVAAFATTDWTTWAPDNDKIKLGDDSDFSWKFNSVNSHLECVDASGNVLGYWTDDGTTGSFVASNKLGAPLLNLAPGSAPGSPANGDVWTTSAGLYARINGATVGPYLGSGGAGAFTTLSASGTIAANATDNSLTTGGRIIVGDTSQAYTNPAVIIKRTLTADTGHGYVDQTIINTGASYAAFDVQSVITGSKNYTAQHLAGMQSNGYYYGAGNLGTWYSFTATLAHEGAGNIGTYYGLKIAAPIGVGTFTNKYGVVVAAMTGASTENWQFVAEGTSGKSYIGGSLLVNTTDATKGRLAVQSLAGGTKPIVAVNSSGADICQIWDDMTGDGVQYLLNSSSAVKVVLNSNGDSYFDGGGLHVGGTSDAGDNNLLVDGNVTAASFGTDAGTVALLGNVTVNTSNATNAIDVNSASNRRIVLQRTGKAGLYMASGFSSAALFSVGSYPLVMGSNEVAALTIETTQNVTVANDLAVNGGDMTCTANTFNLLNATVTTANAFGAATVINFAPDINSTVALGRAKLGSPTTDEMTLAHYDNLSSTNYALKQTADGTTYLNAASTKAVYIDINNALCATIDATGILSQGSVWANSILYGGNPGVTRGIVTLYNGASGNTPGYAKLYSPNGTAWYLFVEDDGTVKIANAAPTANASGTEVGGQT